MRALALAAIAMLAIDAHADFVRGSIKIDVRDGAGKPTEAAVTVRGAGPAGGDSKVARVGDVYVADGLIDGDYTVAVAGAGQSAVHVKGHLDRGVVFVIGGKKPGIVALGPRDVACDPLDGAVVEAVAFSPKGGLGAGRIDVKQGGKVVCSAIVAGGAATLRLLPGDYAIVVKLVGGGAAMERYKLKRDQTPYPLALHTR
ncbi:MAG TPA: hypothetical protein VGL86_14680 [Polyangia bacterium]|jgi:hypothetical protein